MRRNTLRLLKYLVVAGAFVLFGPMTLRYLLGNQQDDGGLREVPVPRVAQGMPESPDVVKRIRDTRTVSTVMHTLKNKQAVWLIRKFVVHNIVTLL